MQTSVLKLGVDQRADQVFDRHLELDEGASDLVVDEYDPPAAPVDGGTPPARGALRKHSELHKAPAHLAEQTLQQDHQEASAAAQGNTTALADKKVTKSADVAPALSCAFAGWMWGVLVIAALAGLLWLRLRR